MSVAIGTRINNRYRLVSRMAHGGMAEVYEAYDLVEKRNCAIKFILESLLDDKTNIARFAREAQLGKKLNHKGIIKVYDSGIFENRPFIVSEYINGQTLDERIKLHSNITYLEACEIMIEVCDILAYLHLHSIIHRDVKPDNIYYLFDGTVKLGDFGVAMDLTNIRPEDLKANGNAHYMAPEVCRNERATPLSDIYSLGITFYELITGELPFKSNDQYEVMKYHMKYEIPHPSQIAKNLPKPIEKVILKATRGNKEDRYQSMKEMKNDLLMVLDNRRKYSRHLTIFQKIFGFKGER